MANLARLFFVGFAVCSVMSASAWSAAPTTGAPTLNTNEPPFTLTEAGFQLGLNFSTLYYNGTIPPNGTDGHTGLDIGGQVEMTLLGNFLFLQPELRYVQHGFALSGVAGSDVNVSYLQVPVLAKLKFETTPGMHPFLLFGPNFGIKLSSSYDTGSTSPPINFWDFGLDFGAGIEYDLSQSVNFFGEARYCLGLSNVNGLAGSTLSEQFNSFQLLAGLNFYL